MPRALPSWLSPVLLALAVGALFLPRAMHGLVPSSLPGFGVDEMRARLDVAQWASALLAVAALGALALEMRGEPLAARDARAFLVVGLLLAVFFALPGHEAWAAHQARVEYERTGVLRDAPGVTLDGVHNSYPGHALAFAFVPPPPAAAGGPVVVEDVPIRRGDAWLVTAYQRGPRWEGFEPPALAAPGVACELRVLMDSFGDRTPAHGAVWRCVAQRDGVTTVTVDYGVPDARPQGVDLIVVPVLHAAWRDGLDERLSALGAGVAAGAALLLVERRWRTAATTTASG